MGIVTRRAGQKVKKEKSARVGQTIKKTGATEWNGQHLIKLLQNETYAGVWYYGKRDKDQKFRSRRDWIPVNVPPIINPELWQMAQSRFEVQKHRSNNQKHQYSNPK